MFNFFFEKESAVSKESKPSNIEENLFKNQIFYWDKEHSINAFTLLKEKPNGSFLLRNGTMPGTIVCSFVETSSVYNEKTEETDFITEVMKYSFAFDNKSGLWVEKTEVVECDEKALEKPEKVNAFQNSDIFKELKAKHFIENQIKPSTKSNQNGIQQNSGANGIWRLLPNPFGK